MDYETLDNIADAYIPLLAITALFSMWFASTGTRTFKTIMPVRALVLFAFLGTAYGMMFIDNTLALWPSLEWDYSTHTAVSLVLVLFLALLWPKQQGWLGFSWLTYCALMLYQQYHTVADILSTACCIIVLLAAFLWPLFRPQQTSPTPTSSRLKNAFPWFDKQAI